MNLLYDNIIFSLQKSGGISVVWSELIKRIIPSGHKVSFIEYENACQNSIRKHLYIPEKSIIHKNSKNFFIKRYFSPKEPITQNTIFHSSYYRVIKHPKVINVTYVQDFIYEYYRKGIAKYVHFLQKKYALENSDLLICISESTKNDLLKFFPKVSKDKIKVIYNGVSDDFFKIEDPGKNTAHLPFEPSSYLIYVGNRSSKYKNFETLIKHFPKKMNLVVAGGNQPEKKEIELLNKHIQPGNYKFTGYISNEKLNILYNNATALVYPSLYEGFGIPVLEAQKASCPVIALSYSSIPEVAGDAAILLSELTSETLNCALEKLRDEAWRQNLIKAGIANADKFSWDKTFYKLLNAYSQVWEDCFT